MTMQQAGNDLATTAVESPSISLGRAALAVRRSFDQLATPLSETLLKLPAMRAATTATPLC